MIRDQNSLLEVIVSKWPDFCNKEGLNDPQMVLVFIYLLGWMEHSRGNNSCATIPGEIDIMNYVTLVQCNLIVNTDLNYCVHVYHLV